MANARKPTLSELQSWLRWTLTHPDGIEEALRSGSFNEPELRCLEWIQSEKELSREERLQIYSNAYILRLREALMQDFPFIQKVLGEKHFAVLVEQYLQEYPSKSFNLGEVGLSFPRFLKLHSYSKDQPFLSEVAELELLKGSTFYSLCPLPLSMDELKQNPAHLWENAKIVLNPTVRFLRANYSIEGLWDNKEAETIPRIEPAERSFLIFRTEEHGVQVKFLHPAQILMLKSFEAQESLGSTCEKISLNFEESSESTMLWFREWIEQKVIVEIRFRES